MSHSAASQWLAFSRPPSAARLRLFCFPHAGLGASVYRSWVGALDPHVEICPVQLPGRETRQLEPPFTRMEALLDAAEAGLRPYLDRPFALFGNSMGALVAFELARRLRSHPGLRRLFVSARRAPHLREPLNGIAHLPDGEFTTVVQQRYGGIPEPVLTCAELLELLVPRLRADFQVLESYACGVAEPLPCDISAFGGAGDATLPEEDLRAWDRHTRGTLKLRVLEGGHLFLQEQRQTLLGAIAEDLAFEEAKREVPA